MYAKHGRTMPVTIIPWGPALSLLIALGLSGGCTRRDYRLRADRETYGILAEKNHPQWWTPPIGVEAPPTSRNYDPYDPDHPPMPPDDPAAHGSMHYVNGMRGSRKWHRDGDAPAVESPQWLASLELSSDGTLRLTRDRAVEVGLLNSREYQFALEEVYLAALALSLERFEFDVRWFGTNTTSYQFLGKTLAGRDPPQDSNALTTASDLGFSRAFSTGGQLIVDFANTFVWEFTGTDSRAGFSNLTVSLVQPLLRGAFRDVRLEALTQSERNVLYAVRDFARFRKQFYYDTVSGQQGFLALLLQLQGIRNLEANLLSVQQNLRAHEALARAGLVSPIRVDQAFQSYQAGRLLLIQARNDLETALDAFKIRMGLPPELAVRLDDSLLAPFELTAAEMTQLETEAEALLAEYRNFDEPPTGARLRAGFTRLTGLQQRVAQEAAAVAGELEQWVARARSRWTPSEDEYAEREASTRKTLTTRLIDLRQGLAELKTANTAEEAGEIEGRRAEAWESLQKLARRQASYVADLGVIQAQIRAYLIEFRSLDWKVENATLYALTNRLDLMNRQAAVVDAWRKIRVAADALEPGLDVFAEAKVGTEPGNNPLAFSSSASSYRVGVSFDGPLNRKAERNIYRTDLIEYQRARRGYLAGRDAIVQSVRLDVRKLTAERLEFEIARQSLITAARQVELARIQLLAPGQAAADSSTTQDVLDALNRLLEAKNALIAVWIAVETDRLQLLLDTEALQLDERGLVTDDDFDPNDRTSTLELLPPGQPERDRGAD